MPLASDLDIYAPANVLIREHGEDASPEAPSSANVRYGSKADVQRPSHLCPLLGVKRTSNVRFQGPAADPAGAEDVTDVWGRGHEFAGHGFVGAVVV